MTKLNKNEIYRVSLIREEKGIQVHEEILEPKEFTKEDIIVVSLLKHHVKMFLSAEQYKGAW